ARRVLRPPAARDGALERRGRSGRRALPSGVGDRSRGGLRRRGPRVVAAAGELLANASVQRFTARSAAPSHAVVLMNFEGLDAKAPRTFPDFWLPAWTGNRPEYLVSYYTEDAFYSDPAVPDGVRGQRALLAYFTKLLGRFPDWVWTHRGSQPLKDGFLNGW